MKIYRPSIKPEAVVIDFEDETMPAYIPKCAEYAFKALQRLAAQQMGGMPLCPECHAYKHLQTNDIFRCLNETCSEYRR